MIRSISNKQLTSHFRLYEFIEAQMPAEAVALNWMNLKEDTVFRAEKLALELEKIRKMINENFYSDLGFSEIGIRITSGYRCEKWEHIRSRSGESQHTIMAADFQPTNCSIHQSRVILNYIYNKLKDTWDGGLAIKYGKGIEIGFIHIDHGQKRRWGYD